MIKHFTFRRALLILLSAVLFSLYGCEPFLPQEQEALDQVPDRLTVYVQEHPLVYKKDSQGQPWGIDAELLEAWSQHYQLKISIVPFKTRSEALSEFKKGRAHILIGRFGSEEIPRESLIGPILGDKKLSLFCLKKAQIQSAHDLKEKVIGLLKSDQQTAERDFFKMEPLSGFVLKNLIQIKTYNQSLTRELFVDMANKKIDCAIGDDQEAHYSAKTFLMTEHVFDLPSSSGINWIFNQRFPSLPTLFQIWHQKAMRKGLIASIQERYRTDNPILQDHDIRLFYESIQDRFSGYRSLIMKASRDHQLSWQLVAAVAYQESQWNPEATSFTGVKGIMQLTQETAEFLGVTDREDPEQSILGGAKYLKYLYLRVNEDAQATFQRPLPLRERWMFALAAYNIGSGHLRDAQRLALRLNKNPLSWRDLKAILPLLEKEEHFETLPYGKARGSETVDFVERVLAYYRLMVF